MVDGRGAECLVLDRVLLLDAVSTAYAEDVEPVLFWDRVFNLLLQSKKLQQVPVNGYARTIHTVDQYIHANFEVLTGQSLFRGLFKRIPLHSGVAEKEQAVIGAGGELYRSMISDNCLVEGVVRDSVLFPGAAVGKGALVEKSVLLPGALVGSGARVHRSLVAAAGELPPNVKFHVGENAVLGDPAAKTVNEEHAAALARGYSFLAPGAYLPKNIHVGGGCYLAPGVNRLTFRKARKIPDGQSVSPARPVS